MPEPEDDIVIESGGRLRGCHGRVLIALIVLALLLAFMVYILFQSILSGTQPTPVRRAAADTVEAVQSASMQSARL